jgi:site-specific DNA recombinase
VLCKRLSKPDAADLLVRDRDGAADVAEMAAEANALRERIREAGDLWESGVLSMAEFRIRKARLAERLEAVQGRQRSAAGRNPIADLAGRTDAAAVWAGLDLGRRRAILETLAVVTVLPVARPQGRSPFNPESVKITWRTS